MKKILTILMLLVLAACEYRGNINFLPIRNKLFTVWQTEEIFYYEKNSGEEFLAESTTTTEEKFEKGQVLITHRGDQMAFSKTVRTDYYSTETIKPTKSVVLDSAYSPVKIDKDSEFIAFGEISLKGEKYTMPQDIFNVYEKAFELRKIDVNDKEKTARFTGQLFTNLVQFLNKH